MNVAEQRILEKKLDDNTRDEVLEVLAKYLLSEVLSKYFAKQESDDLLREIAIEGCVGYKNMDDDYLVQELHDLMLLDEHGPSEVGDLYRKAKVELESYKILKGSQVILEPQDG